MTNALRLTGATLALLLLLGCSRTGGQVSAPPKQAPLVASTKVALDPGDVLTVKVFGEKDLSGRFQISEAGTIDYPLVGRIQVVGLQPPAVASLLRKKLAAGYLAKPHVAVFAEGFQNKKKIYVWGQVRKSGTFNFKVNMTLIEAITMAGGLSPLADKGGITLTRQSNGEAKHYRVSIAKSAAYRLTPGDVIHVPERVF